MKIQYHISGDHRIHQSNKHSSIFNNITFLWREFFLITLWTFVCIDFNYVGDFIFVNMKYMLVSLCIKHIKQAQIPSKYKSRLRNVFDCSTWMGTILPARPWNMWLCKFVSGNFVNISSPNPNMEVVSMKLTLWVHFEYYDNFITTLN